MISLARVFRPLIFPTAGDPRGRSSPSVMALSSPVLQMRGMRRRFGPFVFVYRQKRTICLPCYDDKFSEKERDICADQLKDSPFNQDGTR